VKTWIIIVALSWITIADLISTSNS
jgi:hypothetical protein